jgi:phage tail-like protein
MAPENAPSSDKLPHEEFPMPPPGSPFLNSRFRVEIDQVSAVDFAEVILPDSFAEVVEYRNGGDPRGSHKTAGTVHSGCLVLRRGVTESNEIFAWWTNIANGVPDRRNVAVILLDEQLQPVKQWNLTGVWPSRYVVAPLVAADEAVTLIETIECVTDGMQLA